MKKAIATLLSLFVGLFGYTIVDKATEERLSELENSVSSLVSVATSQENEISSLKELIRQDGYVFTETPSTEKDIIDCYNYARKATGLIPDGSQKYEIKQRFIGDESINGIINNSIENVASSNSHAINRIPAYNHSDILISDIRVATASNDGNGNIVIAIYFKDQVDGPNGDEINGGSVSRGVGTVGSIDNICNDMGASISEGKDNFNITYTEAYAKNIVINMKTGKIISGEWHYRANVYADCFKGKLSILSFTLEEFNVDFDYTANVYNLLDNA